MARASSVISVSIIGDAKKLISATGQADVATGGLIKSFAKLAVVGIAVREGFDFLQGSTEEADRLNDAITRLNIQLGPGFTGDLEATASGFRKIGASSQDILTLEANFADLATTLGIANPDIADTAANVAAVATAVSLLEDVDPDTVIEQIGKAAGGSERAALALGVTLLDNVDATTQLKNILEQLQPKLDSVTTGTADLEQSQRTLQASVEELQGKIGGPLSDALAQVVGFINDEIDAIPHAIEGWQMLGGAIEGAARDALGPLAQVADAIREIISLFDNGQRAFQVSPGRAPRGSPGSGSQTDRSISDAQRRQQERNGLGT